MVRSKYLSEYDLEEFAAQQRHLYHMKVGHIPTLGISAEDAAFHLLGIDVDWESFGEVDHLGKTVLPSLGHPARLVLNEDHLDRLFLEVSNLENTTIAHELGHLLLHVDHGKTQQLALGLNTVDQIEVPTPALYDPLKLPTSEIEWQEWQAHTFMRHFLVPKTSLRKRIGDRSITERSEVTALAEEFKVTLTVLRIQIEKLSRRGRNKRSEHKYTGTV